VSSHSQGATEVRVSISHLDHVGLLDPCFVFWRHWFSSLGQNTGNADVFLSFPQSLPPNAKTGSPSTSFPNLPFKIT